ncbi:MAG: hypothetical protein JNK87_26330 [Bryobacterales bacterium]|nr:hypothetical protein [Bryobacterales bacterium]
MQLVLLALLVRGATAPVDSITLRGVTDAAAMLPQLSPGMLIILTGFDLATAAASDPTGATTTLAGVTVLIDDATGTQTASLLTVTPDQIRAVLPLELAGDEISIHVERDSLRSNVIQSRLLPVVPRLCAGAGGVAQAYHADGAEITPDAPAEPGERVRLALTGMGRVGFLEGDPPYAGIAAVMEGESLPVLATGPWEGRPGISYADFVTTDMLPNGGASITIDSGSEKSQPGIRLPTRHREFFVAPDGSSSGAGTESDPWDLATALAPHPSIQAGDTIWLRGGVYGSGTLIESRLQGEPSRPVILRQFPNERAVIDGGLAIHGGYTWYWGFEVTNSNPLREQNPQGINTYEGSRGVKLINLIIHDTAQGVGFWEGAVDAEINGCLLYHNGYQGSDRGHGHGIYAQNREGTKIIRDNIIFNQFGTGIHVYGTERAAGTGLRILGNAVFNNGSLAAGVSNVDNILLAVGTPMADIVVDDNYTWHQPTLNQGTSRLGWVYGVQNRDLTARNNYWIGGFSAVECWRWDSVTYRGNVSYAPRQFPALLSLDPPPEKSAFSWDRNTYYGAPVFRWNGANLTFAQWRSEAKADANSTHVPGPPRGQWTFIRKNIYEPGRAHVIVYNWDQAPVASFDLSGVLAVGSAFEVRDAQNYFADPVYVGTFRGGSVELPLPAGTVATPLGDVPSPPSHTAPHFYVFVILPK